MKALPIIAAVAVFLGGLFLLAYPFASDYLDTRYQSIIYSDYTEAVADTAADDIAAELEKAAAYNETLAHSVVALADPFRHAQEIANADYDDILNITADGIMAYLEIPKIGVYLPVYHGTESEILAKGIGHLPETSLPVGGPGSHAVLSGHTGLSAAKLLSDLDQLRQGDTFFIHVYSEVLTYQVDQICIVEPTDTTELQIISGEDHVTLVTCHPYGVNSHRLLVRGVRIETDHTTEETELIQPESVSVVESSWLRNYCKGLLIGGGIVGLLLLFSVVILRKRR